MAFDPGPHTPRSPPLPAPQGLRSVLEQVGLTCNLAKSARVPLDDDLRTMSLFDGPQKMPSDPFWPGWPPREGSFHRTYVNIFDPDAARDAFAPHVPLGSGPRRFVAEACLEVDDDLRTMSLFDDSSTTL